MRVIMSRELSDDQRPRSTLSYFFREAMRRIWVSKRNSFVAVSMIAMSLLIVGTFLLLAENLGRAVGQAQGQSRVKVFFEPEATPSQIAAVSAYLGAHPDFALRRFVSQQEALARFRQSFSSMSEVISQLDENPFPPSFECAVPPRAIATPAFRQEIAAIQSLAGVEQVQFDWEWIERLKRLINLINLVGIVTGGLLAIAAAFTIANVIRLTMLLYREEIDIMRLVGATERMIRGPFLLEGIIQGLAGGMLSVGLLLGAFVSMRHFLVPANSIVWGFLFNGFLPWPKIAAMIGGGMLAGLVGSWLSVRETGEEPA